MTVFIHHLEQVSLRLLLYFELPDVHFDLLHDLFVELAPVAEEEEELQQDEEGRSQKSLGYSQFWRDY